METLEMSAIMSQNRAVKSVNTGKHARVRRGLPAVLLHCQHIMAHATQLPDDRDWKTLIGIQLHPQLLPKLFFALFVLPDGIIDFVWVGGGILPSGF
jgi:hypothetical protein